MDKVNKADTFNFDGLTDEQIASVIKQKRAQITTLSDQIAGLEDDITYYQAEQRRREIDAFWQENEGLRLEVGDKLLVTEDYIEWNEPSRLIVQSTKETIGTVYTITKLAFMKDAICIDIHTDKKWLGWIDLPIARRMRLAWLASVQEAQP